MISLLMATGNVPSVEGIRAFRGGRSIRGALSPDLSNRLRSMQQPVMLVDYRHEFALTAPPTGARRRESRP
jgi:hypothetical protein